jgi:hypothetical protein
LQLPRLDCGQIKKRDLFYGYNKLLETYISVLMKNNSNLRSYYDRYDKEII